MNKFIQADLFRYAGLTATKGLFKGLGIPGFKYIFFHRKVDSVKRNSLAYWCFMIFKNHYKYKFGIQIPNHTKIGKGLFIGHFGNIVINGKTKIGEMCNIAQGVTIGQINRGSKAGAPTIGNKVWIGPNAVIVGNIVIGDNVLIAPLSYVNFDVPSNCIVMGNPAKVILKEDPTKGYINFTTDI